MSTRLTALAALVLFFTACSEPPDAERREGPRLVVSVVVDQLPRYLLERYDSLYTGGLRRLLDEGHVFPDAVHDHSTTETAVGHASLATGVHPARHGVVSNGFYRRDGDVWIEEYAVEDPESPILGEGDAEGRSPENVLASGLADWMLLADSASRRISISTKDRTAITHGGSSPGHVYWLSPSRLRFVTSTYYRDALPGWLEEFNGTRMARLRSDTVWTSTVPPAAASMTRPDTSSWERSPEASNAFPHRFHSPDRNGDEPALYDWIIRTPFLDRAVLDLALRGVEELDLGEDDVPDFLAVGLSQTDYVGHRYGPLSREQLDNLLRLDRALGAFFDELDKRVGPGRWVLGFSADHGVLVMPEHRRETDRFGYRATEDDARRIREAIAGAAGGEASAADERERIARALERLPFVEDAVTEAELRDRTEPADSFIPLYRNVYREDRRGDEISTRGVWLRFREGVLAPSRSTGTSHGSPYLYDRGVPMIFLGAGVVEGSTVGRARTIDFAPTLAALAGIPHSEEVDGTALLRQSSLND